MENQSELRITESIIRLNGLLQEDNHVLLLDFSHFLSVSKQHDSIIVKTCGLQWCAAKYEVALEEAYGTEGFIKYGIEEREQFFVCDFPERAQTAAQPGPLTPSDYKFGPKRNLNKHRADVGADTEKALKWFDGVKNIGLYGSGVVLSRGTRSMQSNIYLFLARNLGVGSDSPVQLNRQGEPLQGVVITKPASNLLKQIFYELNELLRDEMEETAAHLYRRYFTNVIFATHEIANVESNISAASALEISKAHGLGLCIALSVGVDLGSLQKRIPPEVDMEYVVTFLKAYSLLVEKVGGVLTWSLLPEALQHVERWQAFVVFEVTRNAKKYFEGQSIPQLHWDFGVDGEGLQYMSCVSSPHNITDYSIWPWQGSADPESMNGTHFITRLAKASGFAVVWKAQKLETGSQYSRVTFELTRNGRSR